MECSSRRDWLHVEASADPLQQQVGGQRQLKRLASCGSIGRPSAAAGGGQHARACSCHRAMRCSDSVDVRVSLSRKCWRGKNVLCRKVRDYVNWGSVL